MDHGNILMFVIRGVYVFAIVVGLACNPQVRRLPLQACAALSAAAKRVSGWRCRAREARQVSEVDLLTASRLEHLRVEHFKYGFYLAALFSVFINGWMMPYELRPVPSSETWTDVMRVAYHGVVVIVTVCPGMITPKTVDAIYGSIFLAAAIFVSPWARRTDTLDHFPHLTLYLNVGAFVLTMLTRCALASVVLNLIFAASVCSMVAVHGPSIAANPNAVIAFQIIMAFVYPATAQILEHGMRIAIRNGLEMEGIHELLEAACALLRSCCEVVLEMDAEGAILSEASELGGFLLQGPGRCFRGRALAGLIAEAEERDAFLEKLRSPPPNERLAQAMHVRIRDANGELVKVELLWFGFRHLDGRQRYMLGLREWNEQNTCAAIPLRSLRAGPREDAAGGPRPCADDGGYVSSSSDTDDLRAIATVDTTEGSLTIQHCSEVFRSRIGRLEGSSLTDFVEGDGDAFVLWVQQSILEAFVLVDSQESLVQEDGTDERQAQGPRFNHWRQTRRRSKCRLTFKVRQRKLDATCRLVLPPGELADLEHVQVLFSKLQWQFDDRRTPSERRAPPTMDPLRGTPTTHASI